MICCHVVGSLTTDWMSNLTVMTSKLAVWAVLPLFSVMSSCMSSGGQRVTAGHPSASVRTVPSSHKEEIRSGGAGAPAAELLPAGRTRGGPHVIARELAGRPITVRANLIPIAHGSMQTFRSYIVIAGSDISVQGPQTRGVIASSPRIRSDGSSTRSLAVTVGDGLAPGLYYVIGVLDWTEHFSDGSTGNGQIQPLVGLIKVSHQH